MNKSRAKKHGKQGEKLAADYLTELGYTVRERNYRGSAGEIDIICQDHDVLVFIEVKSAKSQSFGDPLEWVDRQKQERIGNTANEYLGLCRDQDTDCRFDIITVDLNSMRVNHYENAFWFD